MSAPFVDEGKHIIARQAMKKPERIEQMFSTLEEAVQLVTQGSDARTKRRQQIPKSAIDTIESHALQNGLDEVTLEQLVNVITSNSHGQSSQNALIKCLYPAQSVSSDVVYRTVSSLGHGTLKASVPTQQALLKWLIMVYDSLGDTASLSRCYNVLFNLIDMMSLRDDLCHFLSMITRRKHVRPFRIKLLDDLARTAGDELALQKLMLVYEGYAPGSFEVKTFSKKASDGFAHPDSEWVARLERVQEAAKFRRENPTTGRNWDGSASLGDEDQDNSATAVGGNCNGISRFDDIISNFLKPESADVTLYDLGTRVFHTRATLMPADDLAAKLDALLTPLFDAEIKRLESGRPASRALAVILEKVLSFAKKTKILPDPTIKFLISYLSNWNGIKDQNTILSFLSYLPIQPFEEFQRTIFSPLEEAILSTPPITKTTTSPTPHITILNYYTTLLSHWTSHLLSRPTPPTRTETTPILALTTHTTLLTHTLLTTIHPSPLTTTLPILHHLQTLTPLLSAPLSLSLPPPSPLTTSLLLLTSPTLATLHSLTSLLSTYKHAFSASTPPLPIPPTATRTLNATLIDTCNLLFRSRAFNTSDQHALGCLLPPQLVEWLAEYTQELEPPLALGGLWGLSCHAALVGLSDAALREMEEECEEGAREDGEGGLLVRHAGPVTARSLVALVKDGGLKVDWRQYRVAVLKSLDEMGVSGTKELGEATMKGLMGDQDGLKASQIASLAQ